MTGNGNNSIIKFFYQSINYNKANTKYTHPCNVLQNSELSYTIWHLEIDNKKKVEWAV